MCECGCSQGPLDCRFIGPDGIWYGMRVYAGCGECDAPVGVDLFRLDRDDHATMDGKHAPLAEWQQGSDSYAVLSARELIAGLRGIGIEIDDGAYSERDISEAIRSAVYATMRRFSNEKRKNKRKRVASRQESNPCTAAQKAMGEK